MNFKDCDSIIILLGDFNARTGTSEDLVELDNEHKEIACRSNRYKITIKNGRCLLDLCKTTETRSGVRRIGVDRGMAESTCITQLQK